MVQSLKTHPKSFYGGGLFIAALLLSNFSIQKMEVTGEVPPLLVLATVIDIMIVLPVVLFLFVLRRKPTLSLLAPLWLLGAGFVHWIVPAYAKEHLQYMNVSIILVEAGFVLLEFYLLVIFIKNLKAWKRSFKASIHTNPHLLSRISTANKQTFGGYPKLERLIGVIATDASAIRYAFFPQLDHKPEGDQIFSYHKKSEYFGVFLMLVHAMLIEIIAVHVMLMQYSHTIAWIATLLDFYALVFLIADYQAIRKSPVIIQNNHLHFQKGLRFHMTVPLEKVKEVCWHDGGTSSEESHSFTMMLAGFEKVPPQLEIRLNEAVEGYRLFGFKRKVNHIFLNVDEPERFLETLNKARLVSKGEI
ncbi:hypothetical protein LC065_02740 [Halobacillus litoralis]|uniref:hypothetical protein n=1 Tax=Halobacillus litoralis TaxID=45668 RepID=UPI001CFF15FA|nr:hypothetical protein [Halobacillus litoralis]WLR48191.1 hypothetical protein LC065_02740 [Halobacillus litoralis]